MKMQLTTLAAAIAFATSMAANAQPVTDPNNLDYVGAKDSPPNYGVDNNTTNKDNKAWKHFPPSGTFNTSVYGVYSFKAINNDTFTSELNSMAPSVAASGTNESTIDQTTQNGGAAHGNAASVIQSGGSQNESNITQNKRGQGMRCRQKLYKMVTKTVLMSNRISASALPPKSIRTVTAIYHV